MNRKEVVDLISGLESKYPVSRWRVFGVDVWPVFRNLVFYAWFEKNEQSKGAARAARSSGSGTVAKMVASCLHWLKFLLAPGKTVAFVFSGAGTHRADFAGLSMNRYFDPIMDKLERDGLGVLSVEQGSKMFERYYKPGRTLSLNRFFPLANAVVKLKYKRKVANAFAGLEGFDQCILEVEQLIPGLRASFMRTQIIYMTQTILVWASVFDQIFARKKPKYTLGLCYYTLQMYGMNLSARRNGITSVDMQHGTQGELHINYANFSKVPADGFSVMPKVFWCWDKVSADTIHKWIDRQTFHSVLVGGNPWIEFVRDKEIADLRPAKKVVLYTLQPIEPLIENYVLQTIRNMSRDFEWWLRLHPRQLADRPRLEKILSDYGVLADVNIDQASTLPLPLILQKTAVHISRFSGAVIEAGLLGVNSIVIDEAGVVFFESEIQEGRAYAFLGKQADDFGELLQRVSSHRADAVENVNFADVINKQFPA